MAANVKMITPPHVAETQRLRLENAGLRAANTIMAERLAELGIDAQALVAERAQATAPAPVAAPVPVAVAAPARVTAPRAPQPARAGVSLDPSSSPRIPSGPLPTNRPPQFAEAQIGGARITHARPAPAAARGPVVPVIAGPAPRLPPGVAAMPPGAAAPIIRNSDGSTVQLLPNVTRNAQMRPPVQVAPTPAVAPIAAPVAQQAVLQTSPQPEIIQPPAPPVTIDEDDRARFSLLEID